ncbi:MAG: hypothetical protein NC183_06630, partial [Corallococcus sp.]|nr:hypothetical protein [Corallococcus sp.]
TEGAFSGLTNFLNTTAQAIGLAIPPLVIGLAGYVETKYMDTAEFVAQFGEVADSSIVTMGETTFKISFGNGSVQMLPVDQSDSAQLAIRLTFILLPIAVMLLGIFIASRYKLTRSLQQKIVEANACPDKDSDEYRSLREDLLKQL